MTAAARPLATPFGRASRVLLTAGIVLAALAEAVAATVLSLGRADIIGDTHATPDEFAWLDIGYTTFKLIGFGVAPWLLSRFQPQAALFVATLVMGAACGIAAATTRLEVLVALRGVQGLAGAILLVSGQAILFWTFPRERQPLVQAVFAMGSVVAPAAVTPAVQGWMLDSHSWTWVFFSALPLSLGAAGLIAMADRAPSPTFERRPLDAASLMLLGAFLFSVTYVLGQGSRWDWFQASHIHWLSLVAACAFAMFVVRQRLAGPARLFDLGVFRTDDFSFAFAVSFVAGAALFGSAFLIQSFAVSVLRMTLVEAGSVLLPSSVLFVAALLLAAFFMQARRVPPVATVPFGILLLMAAMWMLSGSNGQSGAADMMPALLLRGLGLGFLFLSITLIAFGRLSPGRLTTGIAIFNIGRQLGALIGVAGLQAIIEDRAAANQTVLGAALAPGSPALADRLTGITSYLIARGVEADAAARMAAGMVGQVVSGQATVIAFNAAFAFVALLFVVAAPMLILFKVALARTAPRRIPAGG